jgi:hypothetical protein
MPQKHHEQAAQHNEEAAKHHRKAAKHASEGNHEKSVYHAHMAHSHQLKANDHANEASKKHVENAMNRMGNQLDEEEMEEHSAGSKNSKMAGENKHSGKK